MASIGLSSFCALLAAVALIYHINRRRSSLQFPIVNSYPWDVTGKKAHAHYTARAKDLISDGLSTHKGPVVIATRSGSKLVLPSSMTDWVKNHKDLGHAEHVRDEYFSEYSGFEGSSAIHSADHELVNIIKTKLSKNENAIPMLKEVLSEALERHWGTENTWHAINWQEDTTALISCASASAFAGTRLSRNNEWLRITTSYVRDYFTAVEKLREWPRWLHPIVHWCLPLSRSCKQHMKQGRTILDIELQRRSIEKEGSREVGPDHPLDHNVLEWTTTSPKPQVLEPIVLQLGLAVAALFTTSEALRQTILEVSKQPKLILELREEINETISRYGWTAKALFEMRLLDSVMKEAQRTLPILVSLERKALRDVVLPDGRKIPRGTQIAVDASLMWSSDVYEFPDRFDGHRFVKHRDAGGTSFAFTSTSKDHVTFGMGRAICPGRFFAETELKLCLAQILLNYDLRLAEGYVPKSFHAGFYPVVDPFAKIEVRRLRTDM